jgi:hypothetical protein
MRTLSLFIFALFVSATVMGSDFGPGVTGGGDADAVEFIRFGYHYAHWLEENPKEGMSATAVRQILASLESSLNGPGPARLVFTGAGIRDQNGIPKMARFDRRQNSVLIDRQIWWNLSSSKRFWLVTVELAGLAGSDARYSEALDVPALEEPGTSKPIVKIFYGVRTEMELTVVRAAQENGFFIQKLLPSQVAFDKASRPVSGATFLASKNVLTPSSISVLLGVPSPQALGEIAADLAYQQQYEVFKSGELFRFECVGVGLSSRNLCAVALKH